MRFYSIAKAFRIPLSILLGMVLYELFTFANLPIPALISILAAVLLGCYRLVIDTFSALMKRQFALDYIALLAVIVSLITKDFLVGAVIALMLASGETLEDFGATQAKKSLTDLIDRIPRDVWLWVDNRAEKKVKIEEVQVRQEIYIRKGEVIALDGILVSPHGTTDESSLTGEPYPVEKVQDDSIRSGTINVGEAIIVKVIRESKDSTYRKIITLVQSAQEEKAPLVRLADKYSTVFTLITIAIAGFAYILHPHLESVLAVLVVATPCPLIIATPIALLGGVNAAAKRRIIIKKLASLESLAVVNAIILDKTGTITLGKPKVTRLELVQTGHPELVSGSRTLHLLSIAEAIERSSLHPLAKAIVGYAVSQKVPIIHADNIQETVGHGISGKVNNKTYTLSKSSRAAEAMAIEMKEGNKTIAIFHLEDVLKEDSKSIVTKLNSLGIHLALFTGDKKSVAEKVAQELGGKLEVKAECTPEQKQEGIEKLKKEGKVTAMVGDGINDAPALALADVGMVFSNEEQTAATDAADVVFLAGNLGLLLDAMYIAKKTLHIAMQSILWGIGMSVAAMVLASFGLIPPIAGAILQEGIDVAVILNALRAAK